MRRVKMGHFSLIHYVTTQLLHSAKCVSRIVFQNMQAYAYLCLVKC